MATTPSRAQRRRGAREDGAPAARRPTRRRGLGRRPRRRVGRSRAPTTTSWTRQKYFWNPLMDYWFRMEIEGWEHHPRAAGAADRHPLRRAVRVGRVDGRHPVVAALRRRPPAARHRARRADGGAAIGSYFRKMGVLPAAPDSIAAGARRGPRRRAVAGRRDRLAAPVDRARRGRARRAQGLHPAGDPRRASPIVPIATVGGPDSMPVLVARAAAREGAAARQGRAAEDVPDRDQRAVGAVARRCCPSCRCRPRSAPRSRRRSSSSRDPAQAKDDDYVDAQVRRGPAVDPGRHGRAWRAAARSPSSAERLPSPRGRPARDLRRPVRGARPSRACSRGSPPRPRRPAGTASSSGTTSSTARRSRTLADPWVAMAAIAARDRARAHRRARHPDAAAPDPQARARDGHARPPQRRPAGARRRDRRRPPRRVRAVRRRRPTRASARGCSTPTSSGWSSCGAASSSPCRCSSRGSRCGSAARWPNRRPVRRALRWDGIFPIDLPGPGGARRARGRGRARSATAPFDLVVDEPGGGGLRGRGRRRARRGA